MAVGLWTNSQSQNLDNLPWLGGIGGSFGGAWPAATWKAFMETQFANLPAASLPTPDYTGFARWVMVAPQAPKKPVCQQGQFQNCRCPHGQTCQPNPNPTCQGQGQGRDRAASSVADRTRIRRAGPSVSPPARRRKAPPSRRHASPAAAVRGGGQPCGGGTPATVGAQTTSLSSGLSLLLTAALTPEEVLAQRAVRTTLLL